MVEIKLNLGCGKRIKKGWINVDIAKIDGIDIVHDLNKFPYPFNDCSVDYILLDNVLEHLDNPLAVMNECYRILKNGGKIKINVPHFKYRAAFTDPEHKHFFTEDTFKHFANPQKTKHFRYNFRYKIVTLTLYNSLFPKVPIRRIWHSYYFPIPPTDIECILEAIK